MKTGFFTADGEPALSLYVEFQADGAVEIESLSPRSS